MKGDADEFNNIIRDVSGTETASGSAGDAVSAESMETGVSDGLLGIKALQHHQAETEKNIEAEGGRFVVRFGIQRNLIRLRAKTVTT